MLVYKKVENSEKLKHSCIAIMLMEHGPPYIERVLVY